MEVSSKRYYLRSTKAETGTTGVVRDTVVQKMQLSVKHHARKKEFPTSSSQLPADLQIFQPYIVQQIREAHCLGDFRFLTKTISFIEKSEQFRVVKSYNLQNISHLFGGKPDTWTYLLQGIVRRADLGCGSDAPLQEVQNKLAALVASGEQRVLLHLFSGMSVVIFCFPILFDS